MGACLTVMALEWTWFHGKRRVVEIIENTFGLYFIVGRLRRGFNV
jgi:hypothetical protein